MDEGMTRRGLLAAALRGAAGVLLGERRCADAKGAAGAIPVENDLLLPNGRPVWEPEQRDLWAAAANRDELIIIANDAIRLDPRDPHIDANCNQHLLGLGGPAALQQSHARFFGAARRIGGFGWSSSFWTTKKNEKWLEELFHRVFAGAKVGWVSLLGVRRPAQLFGQHDPTMSVEQKTEDIRISSVRQAKYLDSHPLLEIGPFVIPTRGLLFATSEQGMRTDGEIFATYVPRHVWSTRSTISEWYTEVWLCQARREDKQRLQRGQVPAVPTSKYEDRAVRVRTTHLLNLVTVDPDAPGDGGLLPVRAEGRRRRLPPSFRPNKMSYTIVAVEINPDGGDILSVRRINMSLDAAMVSSSPVEHLALCEAFRKLTR